MKHRLSRLAALAIAPTLALPACGQNASGLDDAMDSEVYVAVMGELADLRRYSLARTDGEDRQVRADSARRVILNTHGVTAQQLLAFAESAGSDPTRMETLADLIAVIADSLAAIRDTIRDTIVAATSDTVSDTLDDTPVGFRVRSAADPQPSQLRTRLDSLRDAQGRPGRRPR